MQQIIIFELKLNIERGEKCDMIFFTDFLGQFCCMCWISEKRCLVVGFQTFHVNVGELFIA